MQYPKSIYIERNADLFAFADDRTLICAEKDQNNLVTKLQILMDSAHERFEANCLTLIVSKSQFLFLCRTGLPFPGLKIIPNSKGIVSRSQNKFVWFLRVLADENLSFKNHINLLRIKVSRNLGIMH